MWQVNSRVRNIMYWCAWTTCLLVYAKSEAQTINPNEWEAIRPIQCQVQFLEYINSAEWINSAVGYDPRLWHDRVLVMGRVLSAEFCLVNRYHDHTMTSTGWIQTPDSNDVIIYDARDTYKISGSTWVKSNASIMLRKKDE